LLSKSQPRRRRHAHTLSQGWRMTTSVATFPSAPITMRTTLDDSAAPT
jgi:hypothetical protein